MANGVITSNRIIKERYDSGSVSVPANNILDITNDVSKTGYTILGIVGVKMNWSGTMLALVSSIIDGNNAFIRITNLEDTSHSTQVVYEVLYCKT